MNPNIEIVTVLDGLAAQLASNSGVCWDRLHNHPGYERNYWRDRAKQVLDGLNNPPPPRRFVGSNNGWVVCG